MIVLHHFTEVSYRSAPGDPLWIARGEVKVWLRTLRFVLCGAELAIKSVSL